MAEEVGPSLPTTTTGFVEYPRPLADFEDVVRDPALFMRTLEDLHATMGTKFMIPKVGGRELDLYRLFVEVTSRGGIQKVIGDKRWREVTTTFNFPPTATNSSFVVRKYYMSLLHLYEQIYYFRLQGWSQPTAEADVACSPSGLQVLSKLSPGAESSSVPPPQSHKRLRANDAVVPSVNFSGMELPMNSMVSGVIDGKCEHGYFVTVKIRGTTMKGILYHVPESTATPLPSSLATDRNRGVEVLFRRRRRRKLRDPTRPKPNRSGYNFFFAEQHARLKTLHPGTDRRISKIIGDLWNNLAETEKEVYQNIALKDKERYRAEMKAYIQRFQDGSTVTGEAGDEPVKHCQANLDLVLEETGVDPGGGSDLQDDPGDDSCSASDGNSDSRGSETDLEMNVYTEEAGRVGKEGETLGEQVKVDGPVVEKTGQGGHSAFTEEMETEKTGEGGRAAFNEDIETGKTG